MFDIQSILFLGGDIALILILDSWSNFYLCRRGQETAVLFNEVRL